MASPRESTVRLPPPDGGCEAWSMVSVAFAVTMHSSSMHYITGLFFVSWLKEFPGHSRAQLASVGSLSTALMFGCAYLSGRLQYHWKSQGAVVLTGAILASLGLLLSSYVTDAWQLYLTFSMIVGIGHALAFPPCPVVVSTWFSSRIGMALGITTAGASIGTIYLGVIYVYVDRAYGWRVAFRCLALISLVAIGTAAFIFRVPGGSGTAKKVTHILSNSLSNSFHRSSDEKKRPRTNTDQVEDDRKRNNKGKLQVLALLRHGRFSRVCLAFLLVSFAFDVPFVHLVRFALDEDMGRDKADWLTSAVGLGGLCRIVVMGAADKIGKEVVFTLVLVAMALSNLILPYTISFFAGALIYAFVIGVCTGCLMALVLPLSTTALKPLVGQTQREAGLQALANLDEIRSSPSMLRMSLGADTLEDELAHEAAANDWPPSASITSGLVYSSIAIGVFLGPALVGWLYDEVGAYGWGFTGCGCFCFAAALLSLAILPPEQQCFPCCELAPDQGAVESDWHASSRMKNRKAAQNERETMSSFQGNNL